MDFTPNFDGQMEELEKEVRDVMGEVKVVEHEENVEGPPGRPWVGPGHPQGVRVFVRAQSRATSSFQESASRPITASRIVLTKRLAFIPQKIMPAAASSPTATPPARRSPLGESSAAACLSTMLAVPSIRGTPIDLVQAVGAQSGGQVQQARTRPEALGRERRARGKHSAQRRKFMRNPGFGA